MSCTIRHGYRKYASGQNFHRATKRVARIDYDDTAAVDGHESLDAIYARRPTDRFRMISCATKTRTMLRDRRPYTSENTYIIAIKPKQIIIITSRVVLLYVHVLYVTQKRRRFSITPNWFHEI